MSRSPSQRWIVTACGVAVGITLFLAARAVRQAFAPPPAWTNATAIHTLEWQPTQEEHRRDGVGSVEAERSPEEIVQRAVAALQQHQINSHVAYVADDIVFELNGEGPYHGKRDYVATLRAIYWVWESLRSFRVAGVVTADQALVDVSVSEERELQRRRPAGGPLEEHQPDRHGIATTLYTIRAGKIVRVKLQTLHDRFKFVPDSADNTWDFPLIGRVGFTRLE